MSSRLSPFRRKSVTPFGEGFPVMSTFAPGKQRWTTAAWRATTLSPESAGSSMPKTYGTLVVSQPRSTQNERTAPR